MYDWLGFRKTSKTQNPNFYHHFPTLNYQIWVSNSSIVVRSHKQSIRRSQTLVMSVLHQLKANNLGHHLFPSSFWKYPYHPQPPTPNPPGSGANFPLYSGGHTAGAKSAANAKAGGVSVSGAPVKQPSGLASSASTWSGKCLGPLGPLGPLGLGEMYPLVI